MKTRVCCSMVDQFKGLGIKWWPALFIVLGFGPIFYIQYYHGQDWEAPAWLSVALFSFLLITMLVSAVLTLVLIKKLRRPGDKIMHLIRIRKFHEAVELGQDLHQHHPHDPLIHLNLVAAYYFDGQKDEAKTLLEELDERHLKPRFQRLHDKWQSVIDKSMTIKHENSA